MNNFQNPFFISKLAKILRQTSKHTLIVYWIFSLVDLQLSVKKQIRKSSQTTRKRSKITSNIMRLVQHLS